jgi:hypothetical protein
MLARLSPLTQQAVSATVHCLTGCAIGEVLGMILSTWWGWGALASVLLSLGLAFFFGYLLAIQPVLRAGIAFTTALGVVVAAETLSIATMETVDNGVILMWPQAIHAGLTDWVFWVSLALSLAIAFVITVPVNRWLISRGQGHAKTHQYMHGGTHGDAHSDAHGHGGGGAPHREHPASHQT